MRRYRLKLPVALSLLALSALLGAGPNPSANAELERQLARVLPEVKFDKVRLEDAIAWLADTTGANVWVAWKELEAEGGITRDTTVSLTLKNVKAITALELLTRDVSTLNCPTGVKLDDGVAVVARYERRGADQVTRAYDVRDLIASAIAATEALGRTRAATRPAAVEEVERVQTGPGGGSGTLRRSVEPAASPPPQEQAADALIKALIGNVTPGDWRENGGVVAGCRYFAGKLVITHTPEGHAAVAAFLDVVRKAK